MHIKNAASDGFLMRHMLLSSIALLLIIRITAWLNTAIISRDSVIYIDLARYWVTGRPFSALAHPYHPLYPFLIAIAARLLGISLEHSAVAVSIIASALTLPALAFLYRRFENRIVLFLGLLFFCVSPYLVRYTADVLSEPIYLLFIAWAAALFSEAVTLNNKRPIFYLFSGIFTGLAYLMRPEGLVVGISGVIWLLIFYREVRFRGILYGILLLTVGVLLIASPYIIYLHKDTGHWILTRKKRVETLLNEISPERNLTNPSRQVMVFHHKGISKKHSEIPTNLNHREQEQAERIRKILGERIVPRVSPGLPVWHMMLIFIESLGTILLGFLNGMFVTIGFWVIFRFFCFRRYPWKKIDTFILVFSLIYWVMLGALLSGYGYVSRRHYSAVTMFMLVWAAIGFIYACDIISSIFKGKLVTPKIVGILFIIPVLGISVIKGTKPYRMDKYGRKIVGRWISERKPKKMDCTILTSLTRVGYYAGCRTIFLPAIGRKDVNALREHKVAYVVLTKRELQKAPFLIDLIGRYGYHMAYHYTSNARHEDIRVFTFKRQ